MTIIPCEDDRLPFEQAVLAACAYRRSGMAWPEIGRRLGYGHNRLRQAVNAAHQEALNAFSWGESGTATVGVSFAAMGRSTNSK
jgi:hypothetical protein